MEMNIKP
jgi:intraflagellar transport protein 46